MRFVIAVVAVVAVFLLFGWMSISSDSDSASVTIETHKVVGDTEEFVEAAAEKLDAASEDIQDAIDDQGVDADASRAGRVEDVPREAATE